MLVGALTPGAGYRVSLNGYAQYTHSQDHTLLYLTNRRYHVYDRIIRTKHGTDAMTPPHQPPRASDPAPPLWMRQGARFLVVGLLNTAVDLAVYVTLTRALALFAAWKVAAKALSYAAGLLNSYYWNRRWTFRSQSTPTLTFPPFVLANLVGLAINAGAMQLCLNTFGLPEAFSLALATGSTIAWNFTLSKFLIFRA